MSTAPNPEPREDPDPDYRPLLDVMKERAS